MTPLQRLTREDADILELERGPIAGHTLKVLILERDAGVAPLTLARLRTRVSARLHLVPRARERLAVTPLGIAAPVWVDDDDFDIARHVRRAPTRGTVNDAHLRELAGEAMSGRLARRHPLWDLELISPLSRRRTALIGRFHHSWADGATAMRVVEALLFDGAVDDDGANHWTPQPTPGDPELLARAVADRVGGLAGAAGALARTATSPERWRLGAEELARLPGAIGRELMPGEPDSPFLGEIGRRRTVAYTAAPLAAYKDAEHTAGAGVTVNDVVLAVVAGGIRRWLRRNAGVEVPLRCKVPVSLHRRDEGPDVGNRDSFMIVELPVGEADPWARIALVHRQTAERKRHHDAETLDALFSDLALFAPPVERLLTRVTSSAREFAINVSNVPGPREPVTILGAKLGELLTNSEVGIDHALRVSAVSHCGELAIGLCADPDVVEDLVGLADAMGASLRELEAGSG